jgi:hypothetical protein
MLIETIKFLLFSRHPLPMPYQQLMSTSAAAAVSTENQSSVTSIPAAVRRQKRERRSRMQLIRRRSNKYVDSCERLFASLRHNLCQATFNNDNTKVSVVNDQALQTDSVLVTFGSSSRTAKEAYCFHFGQSLSSFASNNRENNETAQPVQRYLTATDVIRSMMCDERFSTQPAPSGPSNVRIFVRQSSANNHNDLKNTDSAIAFELPLLEMDLGFSTKLKRPSRPSSAPSFFDIYLYAEDVSSSNSSNSNSNGNIHNNVSTKQEHVSTNSDSSSRWPQSNTDSHWWRFPTVVQPLRLPSFDDDDDNDDEE